MSNIKPDQLYTLNDISMNRVVVAHDDHETLKALVITDVIRLSQASSEQFASALLNPPALSPSLMRAAARRKKLLRSE